MSHFLKLNEDLIDLVQDLTMKSGGIFHIGKWNLPSLLLIPNSSFKIPPELKYQK